MNTRTDEDLIDIAQDRSQKAARRNDAVVELEKRHRRTLVFLMQKVHNPQAFVVALGRGTVEDVCGDVFARGLLTFKKGRGAKFSTWLQRIMQNEIVSGFRKSPRFAMSLESATDEESGRRPEPKADVADPAAALVMVEIVDRARECLRVLTDREQQVFGWCVIMDFGYEHVCDLIPGLSADNFRQIKSRATGKFVEEWRRRGGEQAEEVLQSAGDAMQRRIDPDRIKSAKARMAYDAWRASGLSGAARALGVAPEEARKVLLSALHDLLDGIRLRGKSHVRLRSAALADLLEVAGTAPSDDPEVQRVRRTLDIVRAAFGFAPPEAAVHTLGSFLQSRLRSAADYESACRALGLDAAALRRVLSDDYEPERDFFSRLAKVVGEPARKLKALPRRPIGETAVAVRGPEGFRPELVVARAMRWMKPR